MKSLGVRPNQSTPPAWKRYLLALLLVIGFAAVRLLFLRAMGPTAPYVVFFPAVIVAALYGGIGPGLLATILAALTANYFWIPPTGLIVPRDTAHLIGLFLFCTNGFLVAWVSDRMQRARTRALTAEFENQLAAEQRRATESQLWLAEIVNSSDDAIIGMRLDGVITSWNAGAERIFGYTAAEAIDQSLLRLFPAERAAEANDMLARIARGERLAHDESRRLRKDGRPIEVSTTGSPIIDLGGKIVGASQIVRDITARKAQEREILRLSRLYAALSQVNQAIVRAPTREILFAEVCRVIIKFGQFKLAWIGWLNAGTREIQIAAQCGTPETEGYLNDIRIAADDSPEGRGPTGICIRENRTYVCHDFVSDPITQPWHERAARQGLASSITVPIRQAGMVSGALMVYDTEKNFFGPQEVALIEEAASDISFALDHQAMEQKGQRAEEEIRQRNRELTSSSNLIRKIAGSLDLPAVLDRALHGALEITGLPGGTLCLIGHDQHTLELAAHVNMPAARVQALTTCPIKLGDCLCGQCAVNGEPLILWDDASRSKFAVDDLTRNDEIRFHAAFPLQARNQCIGVLCVFARDAAQPTERSLKLLQDVCGPIALAIENARLFDQVSSELTERKALEAQLANEKFLVENLLSSTPDRIYFKDKECRFIKVNEAFMKLHELANTSPPIGQTDFDLFGTQHARQAYADEQRIIATGQPIIDREEMEDWPDGHVTWASSTKFPLRDTNGQIIGIIGVSHDITERKRAEEQIRLQLSALTATANAIVIADCQGTIQWVNPAFVRLTGYSAEEARGNNSRFLKSGQHPPAFYAHLWSTILAGKVWHGDMVNKRKDGTLYNEDTTITPVRDGTGKIAHFVAIKQDVTERRDLENRMQQAQKMEAIGTLAGGIAHDFNNILAAMLGYASLLQEDTAASPPAQENVAEILKACERARQLVRQILTFSRQSRQKPAIIQLDTVVKEALKFLRASLPAQINIEMNLDAAAPAVLADPTQVYQVVINLATNALHAMEGRPGQLTVSLDGCEPDSEMLRQHPELKPILHARLTVTDTGHGMDAPTLTHIFEPFFTTKSVGKGTGLGLAVVHGIVRSSGGVITVESTVGRGTTFRLYFPAQTMGADSTLVAEREATPGLGENILVIDDEPALTTVVQRCLLRLNYQATITNSASEAVTWLAENPKRFHLVITDLTMPEINGLEVARQLRALRVDLPIILMSGFNPGLTPEDLRAAGICELVEKPVSKIALADAVQRALSQI